MSSIVPCFKGTVKSAGLGSCRRETSL